MAAKDTRLQTAESFALNFVSGMIFAWTYKRTRSIIPGILIHGLTNTLAVLLTAFA
ncbi:CPBP family intramembrane glutamic endopeptidase [Paenibacillus dokdonensis]|uniref:CPBP family intramembrane glutamic endopeptidase n=1 Tax=Paenibacillus dokdonensis TaxID=2567944 RepID=UPI002DB5F5CA|nr:CPBP family intramembrane glutamic endopeptidase [Paenibacillus dokdonensis]